jgi:nitrous oxidase accessory protein NosD
MAAHVVGSPIVYPTIQQAVDAVPVGGTVRVDPGTYNELVTIAKKLTVQGAPFDRSIVDGQDFGGGSHSSAFYVAANDVTIDGFTVQGQTSIGKYGAGIVIAPQMSGTHIVNNVIQQNVAGLYLANFSSTDPAIIRNNIFAFNNNPGANNGRGIYTDGGVSGGNLTNVQIDGNLFVGNVGDGTSGNPEAAIGLEAQSQGKQSNISITNNIMVNNGKGVLVFNATNIVIANNFITGCTDAKSGAIRDEGNVNGMSITGNTLIANKGAAISIVTIFPPGQSSNISINYNNIAFNAGGGLSVQAGAYAGTLDAENNWWGSFFGPSGNDVVTNGNSVDVTPFSRFPIF